LEWNCFKIIDRFDWERGGCKLNGVSNESTRGMEIDERERERESESRRMASLAG
ncbi:hypothetical protein RDWZM_008166, partial [Blomia tropicalis]